MQQMRKAAGSAFWFSSSADIHDSILYYGEWRGGSRSRSQCTEVCGKDLAARSCSKICLVIVYPQGQREKPVTMYAILDDQNNRSLAKSEFFDLFDVRSHPSRHSL